MNNSLSQVSIKRFRTKTVGRAALIVVAAGSAWYLGSGFARLYGEWQATSQPPTEARTVAAEFNSMAGVLPLAGQWTFADMDWNFRSATMTRGSVDRRFKDLAETSPGESAANLPDISQQLSDYVAKLQISPTDCAGNSVYLLDKPTFKAELVVREVAGKRKTVAIAVGWATTVDDWQVFELTPRISPNPKSADAHLLPLPPAATRRGGRFADNGDLLLELISLDSDADTLISVWKNAGWEVHHSGLGNSECFSYLCRQGEDVIYAWSANGRSALRSLMLVRSPGGSDTSH